MFRKALILLNSANSFPSFIQISSYSTDSFSTFPECKKVYSEIINLSRAFFADKALTDLSWLLDLEDLIFSVLKLGVKFRIEKSKRRVKRRKNAFRVR